MERIGVIAGAAVLVYLCRGSGFVLKLKSAWWEQFLHFVPIAVFSALVVLSLMREPEIFDLKIIALACAGFVAWRTRRFGLDIIAGFGALWILILLETSPILR